MWASRPRPLVLLTIAALHALLGAALLLAPPATRPIPDSPPLQVQLLAPRPDPALASRAPPPALVAPPPVPRLSLALTPVPEVTVAPPPSTPATTAAETPRPPDAQAAAAAPNVNRGTATALAATGPTAPPAPPPVQLPPSAIQYLAWPDVVYPAASRRLNETGLVIVAVLVDPDGLPQQVRLVQSSGHERLDRAALEGVRRARFKPYVLNGHPTAGWARIPIPFELTT